MNKILNKHNILILTLFAIFILSYILFLGAYPLVDIDETRYVDMAKEMLKTKDFMTLYVNGEYFFEKPPLYFWIECLSLKLFGISEFTARLPIVLLSLLPLGLLFDICNRAKGFKFAFLTTAVLMTSLEYILITRMAILDSVLTSFCVSSVLCYFYTLYIKESNKKWFWLLSYVFMGLAVLAKGIPGIAIPLITIAISTIIFKTYKETLKYSLIGIPIFLFIALPWHILMCKMYPHLFYHEYIYKHHILRFLGSDVIHRNQPWYFYLMTLAWGLVPHTLMLLGIKNLKLDKFLILNITAALTCLLFFSASGGKLVTYILPIYPFLAVILAEIWNYYIENGNKLLKYALLSFNIILLIGATVFPIVVNIFTGKNIGIYLTGISLIIILGYLIKNIIQNKRFNTFVLQVIFMAVLAATVTPVGYKFHYSFGQNDLMRFGQIAKENNYTVVTYKTSPRYSLLYYSGLPHIEFYTDNNEEWLKKELNKENNLVIVKNRDIKDLPVPVKVKDEGIKYSIVEGLKNDK